MPVSRAAMESCGVFSFRVGLHRRDETVFADQDAVGGDDVTRQAVADDEDVCAGREL